MGRHHLSQLLEVCTYERSALHEVREGLKERSQRAEDAVASMESDLDLGHYERFTGIRTTRHNSITTGRIYKAGTAVHTVVSIRADRKRCPS